MPIVRIEVAQGRDAETLRQGLRAVHEAVRDSFGVRDEQVRVLLTEVPPQHWSAGGKTLPEREWER
ncbi:4-oxalocrotonate tautomerase family protein [Lentzea sp. NPDC051213]|uniref:4-oxalocrotonate tautomerase family protein n=1 Tax=Lentzea sp. NPDC051213 TaxID=3364126 RepID=UPI0037B47141